MKKGVKIGLAVGGLALLGFAGYYGISRRNLANEVVVKLSMPRVHGFRNGDLLVAFDATVINSTDAEFSVSQPFIKAEYKDFFGQDAVALSSPSTTVHTIRKQSEYLIKDIIVAFPTGALIQVGGSIVAGIFPEWAKSLEAIAKPIDMKLTIKVEVDGWVNIFIKDKFFMDVKTIVQGIMGVFTKTPTATTDTTPVTSGVNGLGMILQRQKQYQLAR